MLIYIGDELVTKTPDNDLTSDFIVIMAERLGVQPSNSYSSVKNKWNLPSQLLT